MAFPTSRRVSGGLSGPPLNFMDLLFDTILDLTGKRLKEGWIITAIRTSPKVMAQLHREYMAHERLLSHHRGPLHFQVNGVDVVVDMYMHEGYKLVGYPNTDLGRLLYEAS